MTAWLAGIAISVPFMATPLFTGPIGHALQGGDLSYFVSFLVAGAIYLVATRTATRTAPSRMAAERACLHVWGDGESERSHPG